MSTFLIGLVILILGGFLYGRACERVFKPDDRQTPAYTRQDGVDYVPMSKGRNALINLLNIAGTDPILGPIQGILFGPIAFLMIPIGCVIGGAMHDYFSGIYSFITSCYLMYAPIGLSLDYWVSCAIGAVFTGLILFFTIRFGRKNERIGEEG